MLLIFDFDGTIADTFPIFIEVWNQEVSSHFGFRKIASNEFEALKNLDTTQMVQFLEIPVFLLPVVFSTIKSNIQRHLARINPHPGMKEILQAVKQQNHHLGIMTSNSVTNVHSYLELHDMDIFDFVRAGVSLFGKTKALRKILQKYASHEKVLYVGDETRDIEAAKRCKIISVSVTWGFNTEGALKKFSPDFLIRSPAQLQEIIDLT